MRECRILEYLLNQKYTTFRINHVKLLLSCTITQVGNIIVDLSGIQFGTSEVELEKTMQ